MSSNTENTEAKLAAYIDGQLPPAERAELDQFLAKNPDLQKLLSDLIAQRALLRTLPRDRAPSDIYDTIQAQLERSVLLDDAGQSIAPPVRHSRKSQLFALAAMLLLAVGLGAVLYFALPSSKPNPVEVATVGHADLATTEESDASTKPGLAARPTRQSAATLADAGPESLPRSATVSNAAPASPLAQALSAAGGNLPAEFKSQLQAAPAPQQDQLVLLVSTNDPAKASQQVATYLTSNNISYESVDPAAQQRQRQIGDNGADGIVPGAALKSFDLGKRVAETDAPAPAEDRTAGDAPSALASRRASDGLDRDKDAVASQQQSQKYTYAPTDSSLKEKAAEPSSTNQIVTATTTSALRGPTPRPARPYFIARNITREQAAQLTHTLSAEQTSQRARLITEGLTQLPTAGKLEAQSSAPTTTPAITAAVDPEFTLALNKQSAPTTQAATLPSQAAATTSPATQPGDPLDIVIVVEDEQSTTAPATTAPATEPSF